MISYGNFYFFHTDVVIVVVIFLGPFILKSSALTNKVFWNTEKLRLSKGGILVLV